MARIIRFGVTGLAFTLAFGVLHELAFGTPPMISPRYEVSLSVSPVPIVGAECNLQIKIRSLIDSKNSKIQLHIPPGIELITGSQQADRE